MAERDPLTLPAHGFIGHVIRFCLMNKLVVFILLVIMAGWGLVVAPFDWDTGFLPRFPVAVDAIPNLGENQQIVFTDWPGRSPQDVEDQITYPLTVALLGVPGVQTVRSFSMFGFSSVYIIFNEEVEFYWSRSRILEKLGSLPVGTLPEGVAPALGPDATALGQVFLYTLEGRDPDDQTAGGWDLHELRSIQDWYVRYALQAAEGVSEVASVGGYVREYQIDVDPDAMRAFGIALDEVYSAVRSSNIDVGARTIEVNRVEYIIRGTGFLEGVEDLRKTVVKVVGTTPVTLDQIAVVAQGPAQRLGALDKEGAEAVGGVVVVRQGANPLETIDRVKVKISELAPGLPARAVIDHTHANRETLEAFARGQGFAAHRDGLLNEEAWTAWLRRTPAADWPEWITLSQVTVVPFYDRSGLIQETLGTLSDAIILQILITMIVVIVMMRHLRTSLLVSAVLPLAVLFCFIAMKMAGVEANIVALSGIAIAIGTVVDMGIILCENILSKLDETPPDGNRTNAVYEASVEVGGAVLTAIATTVVSFLPVFTMTGAEGRMFRPLAFTKTFALVASVVLALTVIPVAARLVLGGRVRPGLSRVLLPAAVVVAGVGIAIFWIWWVGLLVAAVGLWHLAEPHMAARIRKAGPLAASGVVVLVVGLVLTSLWLPLGPGAGFLMNALFVLVLVGGLLLFFQGFQHVYPPMLRWWLRHKALYLALTSCVLLAGALVWLGTERVFGFVPEAARSNRVWSKVYHAFPGLGKEFMPPLDEGSFLFMPTVLPHASIGEALDVLQAQDRAFAAIPEVGTVVGKIGRAESPLDPAPVSMIETVIHYKPEYKTDAQGRRMRFKFDHDAGDYVRDEHGEPVPDPEGIPYRQWRDEIRSPDDIWDEIVKAGEIPGTTSAPMLQPIITRIVMLQSGMRAPMGVKVRGGDLGTIERVGIEIEGMLKEVPGVRASAVFAERIVGKPYLEIDIDRDAIARHGLSMRAVQDVIEVAIGGIMVTTTVEGRERYPVRVRYQRELRDSIESLGRILVPAADGAQIPLSQLSETRYVRGPQMIKSEDTFLTGYVTFDKEPGFAEVDVVEACKDYLDTQLASGAWSLPAGVSYAFAGNYENQVRAQRTLSVVLPLALLVIFLILYLQFRSTGTTLLVFAGIAVAWSGGFMLLWLYGQPWFLDLPLAGTSLREVFQVHPVLLSVAVWVGFLALFGIATDDGVVMATYLDQSFRENEPDTPESIREAVVMAGARRIRPCLMTTATTILALLPVLTSTGRGADVMIPMALPSVGGMTLELFTLFQIPVSYCALKELELRMRRGKPVSEQPVQGGVS